MNPEDQRPAPARAARPQGPRLLAAGLATVAGITALVIAILLVRGALL